MTSPRRSHSQDKARSVSIPAGMTLEGKFNPAERPREMEHRLRKDFWSFLVKDLLTYYPGTKEPHVGQAVQPDSGVVSGWTA